jgi:arylsulfatase A-like enzyme
MKSAVVSCLLLALCAAPACSGAAKPNILVIVIDTLRPDRLGAYGNDRGLTPFMDSLASRAYVFRNAYAQTSWTNASVASLVTSRYQSQHRVTSFKSILADQEHTLTEALREHGYATGGFSANFLVAPQLGFGQGFDQYKVFTASTFDANGKETYGKERAERINEAGLTWLDEVSERRPSRTPVYLYLHYMEPHNPYHPPERYLDRVLNGRPRPDQEATNRRMRIPNAGYFSPEIVQAVKDLYDAEVMSVDAALRDLFARLQERRFLDHAVVVVLADHGEEFLEHGLMGHHQTLFEEVIRVPLLIAVPGNPGGVQIETIVSLTDVGPTILDLAQIAVPPSFDGISLRTVMGLSKPRGWWPFGGQNQPQSAAPANVAFSELIKETTNRQRPHERAVIKQTHKLIENVDGEREYYDLQADPGERDTQGIDPAQRVVLGDAIARF